MGKGARGQATPKQAGREQKDEGSQREQQMPKPRWAPQVLAPRRTFGRLEHKQSFVHDLEPNSSEPKRPRRQVSSAAASSEPPRAPGMSDQELSIAEQCKVLFDELEDEGPLVGAGEQGRGGQLGREPSAQDMRFLRWLKQESDNYPAEGAEQVSLTVTLPDERKKLYDWLRFYYDYKVSEGGPCEQEP